MKIIFLDFDGVITTKKSDWTFDADKMNMVKRICDATDAKIVISSSWRRYTLEKTIDFITKGEEEVGNLPFAHVEDIIGITDRMYAFKHGNRENHYYLPRGIEIKQWLKEHREITNYVILDDDCDILLEQKDNFVHTDSYLGFQDKDVELAIEILNRK